MTNLLVFDLIALVNPIDRHLYPGVIGRISDLRSNGWTMAIVSDQPECDWQNAGFIDADDWRCDRVTVE